MAGNAKQHYVPVGYLKPFAGHDGHVWSLDIRSGEITKLGRRNVFFQRHYYRQDWAPAGADPNVLERYFACEVEPALHALRRLAEGRTALTEDEAFSCLLYAAVQYARVPAQLDQAVELMRRHVEAHAMNVPEVREALLSGQFQIVMRKSARFDALGTLLPTALKCLSMMEWEVLEAPPFDEFITTANPVVAFNGRFVPPATPGLGLRTTIVIFPLSPTTTFRLRHRTGPTEVVDLEGEQAVLPAVTRRTSVSDDQVAIQNKIVGAYAAGFAVARSRAPLQRIARDLQALQRL